MYGTLESADTYFASIGFANWATLTDEQKTAALTRGSMILDAIYGFRFPGSKTGGFSQVKQWPRENAQTIRGEDIPDDVIPPAVEIATYEITRSEVERPGNLLPASFPQQQLKKQKLDVLEKEFFKNMSNVPRDSLPYLPMIEGILVDLIADTQGDFPIFWVR